MMENHQKASPEDFLIARYFKPLATHPAARGLIDDAALLASSSDDLVVTTDAIVEGVHFHADDPPDTIARKALRVNLSDLAAKGATPSGFVLTLVLRSVEDSWLAPFALALGEDAMQFGSPLLGGDMVSTPGPLMVSITAFGRIAPGRMVGRDNARVGDRIFVSGSIGDAALGLDILSGRLTTKNQTHRDALIARYRVPQPRTGLASAIREHASASMDVSDGLAGDLAKLCTASKVSARIDIERIPLSDGAGALLRADATSHERLLSGGDDYEILCTVPPERRGAFMAGAAAERVAVTEIGAVAAGSAVPVFVGVAGQPIPLKQLSYSHF